LSADNGLGVPGRRVLTFDADGLRESGPGVGLTLSWTSIQHVESTPAHVFIYFGPQGAIVVPKRIGPDLIGELLSALEAHGSPTSW
jgi:hypothetical protein